MMEEWKEYILGDIYHVQNGYAFSSSDFFDDYTESSYEVLKIGHIEIGGGLRQYPKKSYVEKDPKYKKWVLEKGDIVMGMTDMKSNIQILGVPAMVDLSNHYVLNQRVGRLTIKNPCLFDNDFFYFQMRSAAFLEELRKKANSGVQVNLTTEAIKTSLLYAPSFQHQQLIGRLFRCLEDKISINRRINNILEQQAQALFKSWFVDFEPFKDGEFETSELGMIPKWWSVGAIDNIVEISKKSINPNKYPEIQFVHYSIPSYDNGKQPEKQFGREILSNKFVVKDKMTLFSKLNPRIKRVWFVNDVVDNSICSTEFVPYMAHDVVLSAFVYCLISSQGFYDFVMSLVNGATGSHQRFHPEETLSYRLAFNKEVAMRFSRLVEPMIAQIIKNQQETHRLAELRDTLLPRLMSGEININEIRVG